MNKLLIRLLLSLLCVFATVARSAPAEAVLILNPGLAEEDITSNNLLRVYAMKKRTWSNGEPIVVYILSTKSEVHRDFVYSYLRTQPHHLNRLWHKLVFSGTGTKPEVVGSTAEMLSRVAQTPGAIGYMEDGFVTDLEQLVIKVPHHD